MDIKTAMELTFKIEDALDEIDHSALVAVNRRKDENSHSVMITPIGLGEEVTIYSGENDDEYCLIQGDVGESVVGANEAVKLAVEGVL